MGKLMSRSERAVTWIERFCVVPAGLDRGQRVRLTKAQRRTIRAIYDDDDLSEIAQIGTPLSAYVALLHVCGPEALGENFRPDVSADVFTVWNSVGPDLRAVLRRDGDVIRCPELGTCWPVAA